MNFLVDQKDENIKKVVEVSIQAGELVGVLYDALLNQYIDKEDEQTLKDLNILCVRLVFCFYAEDAGLFGKRKMFHDYMVRFKDDPGSFRDGLIKLFRVLDQKEEDRDPYMDEELSAFPYVNGGLFENENVVIPRIDENIIDIIINKASENFDWSNISPTIFGGVFESTLNPETRRSGGMHYTSMENIHKVIDPLFLNELHEEFKEAMAYKQLNSGVSRPRNAVLMRVFLNLGIVEHTGHGIPMIVEKYGREAFDIHKNYIDVTLHFNQAVLASVPQIGTDDGTDDKGIRLNEDLSDTEKKLIMELIKNPKYTYNQLASEIGISRRTVSRTVASLVEKKYIERVGNHKSGFWKIIR